MISFKFLIKVIWILVLSTIAIENFSNLWIYYSILGLLLVILLKNICLLVNEVIKKTAMSALVTETFAHRANTEENQEKLQKILNSLSNYDIMMHGTFDYKEITNS